MAPPTQPASGVLPTPAAIILLKKKDGSATTSSTARGPRKQADRLKVIIRRLPPGLTQSEFEAALGEGWGVGAGQVNWFDYKPGKISTDFSKPSRPARAYLNLTDASHLQALEKKVLETAFADAKNTGRDAALIDTPTLEFATYTRVPLGKRRVDARQGTIDQDPEFIDFLQSLTIPVTKPAALDAEPAPAKEKAKTTPLIEHLREKKAAREKAGKGAGKAKQQETKEVKGKEAGKKGGKGQVQAQAHSVEAQDKTKKLTKAERAEKAAKEAVKVLNKEVVTVAEKAASAVSVTKETAERKPERTARPISVAARIQQDLGLSPAQRRAKRETNADNAANTASTTASDANGTPAAQTSKRGARAPRAPKAAEGTSGESSKPVPTGPAQPTLLKKPAQPPRGPAASQPAPPRGPKAQHQQNTQPPTTSTSAQTVSTTPTDPSTLPRQAFLKHANPSQGITEPLIEAALVPYGGTTRVEIDRKKGFAYVDFVDNEGMKKAIAASPIKVAQGAVEVKERKEKGSQQQGGQQGGGSLRGAPRGSGGSVGSGFRGRGGQRGGRGGNGNRGGSAGASPAQGNATPAASVANPPAT